MEALNDNQPQEASFIKDTQATLLPEEFLNLHRKDFNDFIFNQQKEQKPQQQQSDSLSTDNTATDISIDDNDSRTSSISNLYQANTELRLSYLDKLDSFPTNSNSNKPDSAYNSINIFDWDDTLLPTSYLAANQYFIQKENPMTLQVKQIFAKMEFAIMRILQLAIQQGDTFIITNGTPGWVEYSTKLYYPCLGNTLKNVTIISARGLFEKDYPNDQRMWKIEAFKQLRRCYADIITNIMCIGDSFLEIEAAKHLALEFKDAFLKNIKMKEKPRPEHITKQLMLICDNFNNLYGTAKNLFISFEKKMKEDK